MSEPNDQARNLPPEQEDECHECSLIGQPACSEHGLEPAPAPAQTVGETEDFTPVQYAEPITREVEVHDNTIGRTGGAHPPTGTSPQPAAPVDERCAKHDLLCPDEQCTCKPATPIDDSPGAQLAWIEEIQRDREALARETDAAPVDVAREAADEIHQRLMALTHAENCRASRDFIVVDVIRRAITTAVRAEREHAYNKTCVHHNDAERASHGCPVCAEERAARLDREVAEAREALKQIANMCDAPHWTTERRYRIRDKARSAAK